MFPMPRRLATVSLSAAFATFLAFPALRTLEVQFSKGYSDRSNESTTISSDLGS